MSGKSTYHLAALLENDTSDLRLGFFMGDELQIAEELSVCGKHLELERAVPVPGWIEEFLRETEDVLGDVDCVLDAGELRNNLPLMHEAGEELTNRIFQMNANPDFYNRNNPRFQKMASVADDFEDELALDGRSRLSKTVAEWSNFFICSICKGAHYRYKEIIESN